MPDKGHKFTIEFHRLIKPADCGSTMAYLVKQLGGRSGPDKVVTLARRKFGIYDLSVKSDVIFGRVGALDFGRAPLIGTDAGDFQVLPMDDHKAILHDSHFAFFAKHDIMVTQFVPAGVRLRKIVELVEHVTNVEPIQSDPLMTEKAAEAIKRFGRVTAASVKVALPDAAKWQESETDLASYVEQGSQAKAGALSATYHAPRGSSLDRSAALAWIDRMRRIGAVQIARLFGKTKPAELGAKEQDMSVNLLNFVLKDRGSVPINDRDIDSSDVYDELIRAYRRHETQIAALYRKVDGN